MELYNTKSIWEHQISEQIKSLIDTIENSNLSNLENQRFSYLKKQLYNFKSNPQASKEKQKEQLDNFIKDFLDDLWQLKYQADINNLLSQPRQSQNGDYCFFVTMAKFTRIMEDMENNGVNDVFIASIKNDIEHTLGLELDDERKAELKKADEVINELIEYLNNGETDTQESQIKKIR